MGKAKSAVELESYKAINELKVKGVYGNKKFERYYPAESFASHVIGFVNKEGTAVMGVEALHGLLSDGSRRLGRIRA